MSRRRRETASETVTQEPEAQSGEGPQIEVKMKGSADEVKAQLGVAQAPVEEKPRTSRAEVAAESAEKFLSDLANPTYIVRVKRLRPKEWHGAKANVEVWTSELPLQWEDIRSEVQTTSGGGTYKVAVVDPATGNMVSARNFDGEGDPIVQAEALSEAEKMMFGGVEKTAADVSLEGLDRRAQVTAKMIEVEALQAQLDDARAQRNGGKKNAPDDSKINDLERRMLEAKHQAELEARDRRHSEEMREMKALILQNSKPAQAQGASEIGMILQQMQKMQESSDKRFGDVMKQMQDDKMALLMQKLDNLEKRPKESSSGMVEFANTAITMKKLFGWDKDDDDDDADPDDDRPWWQIALDRLAKKVTPGVIDKIFSKLDGLESSGKTVSKDDFMRINEEEMAVHARKVAEAEVARITAQQAALPPPPPPSPAPPAAPQQSTKPDLKLLPPAAGDPAPTPPPAAPPPPSAPAAALSLAQKRCQIVAGAVAMIEHEAGLRQRNFEWHYELWDGLPEDVLDAVCTSTDCVTMFDAFKVEGLNAQMLDELKARISADPKAVAWLKRGHDELVAWKKKFDADPSFDPGADDPGTEEDEPE